MADQYTLSSSSSLLEWTRRERDVVKHFVGFSDKILIKPILALGLGFSSRLNHFSFETVWKVKVAYKFSFQTVCFGNSHQIYSMKIIHSSFLPISKWLNWLKTKFHFRYKLDRMSLWLFHYFNTLYNCRYCLLYTSIT